MPNMTKILKDLVTGGRPLTSDELTIHIAGPDGTILTTYSGLENLPSKRDIKRELNVKDGRRTGRAKVSPEMRTRIKEAIARTYEKIAGEWTARHGQLSVKQACDAVMFSIMTEGADPQAANTLIHMMNGKERNLILRDELTGYVLGTEEPEESPEKS